MAKKTPKPTPAHMQKLADLMDMRPEGVNLRQVQNTLSVSPTLAKAALIEIGATEVEGKWAFAEPVAESAPVEPVTIEPEPELNKLTQAVFDGLPPEFRWAAIRFNGQRIAFKNEPEIRLVQPLLQSDWKLDSGSQFKLIDSNGDASDWQNSKIKREEVTVPDVMQCIANKLIGGWQEAHDKRQEQSAKSDFALALEAERQRVLDAVAIGGTAERLAELTGLPVDDVQMHLDVLIDDGAVVERPVIVAMSYGVAV